MKKFISFLSRIFILLTALELTSCGYGALELFHHGDFVDERADQMKELYQGRVGPTFASLSGTYTFVIFTDPHYGSKRSENIDEDEFLEWMDGLPADQSPKFCVCLGDIAERGERKEFLKYCDFVEKIESRGIPVLNIVGNHDLFNSGWDDFSDLCFPYTSFYRFKSSAFSFYALDTGSGSLGPKQFKKLKSAMQSDPRPKIVFSHYPIYGSGMYGLSYYCLQNEEESTRLITLFEKEDVTDVYAGHVHHHQSKELGDYTERCFDTLFNQEWALVTVNETTGKTSTKTIRK